LQDPDQPERSTISPETAGGGHNGQVATRPIFLLSPAWCGGRRAALLLRPESALPLALRLRQGVLPLGEAFTFMSGLYFRGKLAYARAFASDRRGGGAFVITPTRGLQTPETPVGADLLREFAAVDVDAGDPRYRAPLEHDLRTLAATLDAGTPVVLLGSIATGKYVDVLSAHLAPRLWFPSSFIGRGDMSRGGLLLRAARAGAELEYVVLDPSAPRRGPRPARLERIGPADR
jgi:hypothetical protein